MQIKINDNNEITEYALVGGLEGSIEYTGNFPDDLSDNFTPRYYIMTDNGIVTNPNYVKPVAPNTPDLGNEYNQQDEINAMLLKEVAALYTQLGGLNNG